MAKESFDHRSHEEWRELVRKKAEEVIQTIDPNIVVSIVETTIRPVGGSKVQGRTEVVLSFDHKTNKKISWLIGFQEGDDYIANMLPQEIRQAYLYLVSPKTEQ